MCACGGLRYARAVDSQTCESPAAEAQTVRPHLIIYRMPRFAALLRAVSNVAMNPFRRAMEDMGFTDVETFGMSGNLLFTTRLSDIPSLERRIAKRFGTAAFVRTQHDLQRIAGEDPFGSAILFLSHSPSASRRRAFGRLEFTEPRPVLRGRTIYFVYPARLRGRKEPFDFENALGVLGTARSARVVERLLTRISDSSSAGHGAA